MPSIVNHIIGLRRAFGAFATADILLRRVLRSPAPVSLKLAGRDRLQFNSPILLRPTDSDLFVAAQVFGWRDYELPAALEAKLGRMAQSWRQDGVTPIIIDGGANVGYSSLFLAERFPDAVVIAVEPNPAAFELLTNNVAGLPNVVPLHAALWRDENGVDLCFPEHGSWAVQTKALDQALDQAPTPSVTIETLLRSSGNRRLLICKLDIEGAEREVCKASACALKAAACVMAETHDFLFADGGCLAAVTAALEPELMAPFALGENLVFVRPDLGWSPGA